MEEKQEFELPKLRSNVHEGYSSSSDMSPTDERSYYCTFCKRGFSTAQALGGHMNIHRRARAKLKQQSNNHMGASLYPSPLKFRPNSGGNLVNPKSYSSYIWESARYHGELEDERMRSSWTKLQDDRHDDLGKMGELSQLQLFVDRSNGDDGRRDYQNHENHELVKRGQGSDGEELDLELRLGPEPQRMWWCS